MTTALFCDTCGIGLRERAKFCDECGTPTTNVTEPAEYKQVTVLFADVVRSMDIAAALDIERLREVMTELVERASLVARRYDGTVEYNGDGIMALFGAPIALENHAFRACVAALAIQDELKRLAREVERSDRVVLQVRIGLNSGRVIAGGIGSGSLGYAATGDTVGMAQRIESAAPAGEVMLSDSTARLVHDDVTMSNPEWLRIKGFDEPVRAHRLMEIGPRAAQVGRIETGLVGRRWEMAALGAMMERATNGEGCIVNVVGPPGIGKSRVARETAALAAARGFDVFWTFCESHTHDVPFHAVTQLLRAGTDVTDLDDEAARARVREQIPYGDAQDLLLLDDLLGVGDPEVPLPQIDPDARRRRLTALINTASLARSSSALFIVEDAHWIDPVSESMLADLLGVIRRTPSMVVITSRPEYGGLLTRIQGSQGVALAPLGDSDTSAMIAELLGSDSTVVQLAEMIAERAAGNPFFAEEIVHELVQRGVLEGERGRYVSRVDAAEVHVPATVQAAIEARIDRLSAAAKRTLNAASVIGSRFEPELLSALGIDAAFDELLSVELIDQVRFTPTAEYAFHHPLIRSVAYESQLKSDRTELHRRLATLIEERDPASVEENAALIAGHLESSGDLLAAYGWHMRAATSSATRDIDAARVSWAQACRIADALPSDAPGRLPMRIGARTMLCATDWQDGLREAGVRFAELRELCAAAGDNVSLAIGMTGQLTDAGYGGRVREAARLAAEQTAILESIGVPDLTMPLSLLSLIAWFESGDFDQMLRLSQTVIDLADGDPARGAGFGVASPLAIALTWRGAARCWLGRTEWRTDLDDAVAIARSSSSPAHERAATYAACATWSHSFPILNGVLVPTEAMIVDIEDALRLAEEAGNDVALSLAQFGLAIALLNRDDAADRQRGLDLTKQVRDTWLRKQIAVQDVPITDVLIAREGVRQGDRDGAVTVMRETWDELRREDRLGYGVWAAGVLVETLVRRGTGDDLAEAAQVITQLGELRADQTGVAMRDVWLLRLKALVARARGDDASYLDLRTRYSQMAKSLGFEGHTIWADAMSEDV